jgi:hypothetical protein
MDKRVKVFSWEYARVEAEVLMLVLRTVVTRCSDFKDPGFSFFDYSAGGMQPLNIPNMKFFETRNQAINVKQSDLANRFLANEFKPTMTPELTKQQVQNALPDFEEGLEFLYSQLLHGSETSTVRNDCIFVLSRFCAYGQCVALSGTMKWILEHLPSKLQAKDKAWLVTDLLCSCLLFADVAYGKVVDGVVEFRRFGGLEILSELFESNLSRLCRLETDDLERLVNVDTISAPTDILLNQSDQTGENIRCAHMFTQLVHLLRIVRSLIHTEGGGASCLLSTLGRLAVHSSLLIVLLYRSAADRVDIATLFDRSKLANTARSVIAHVQHSRFTPDAEHNTIDWTVQSSCTLPPMQLNPLELAVQIIRLMSLYCDSISTLKLQFRQVWAVDTNNLLAMVFKGDFNNLAVVRRSLREAQIYSSE